MGVVYAGNRQGRDWREYTDVAPPPRAPEARTALLGRLQQGTSARSIAFSERETELDPLVITQTNQTAGKPFDAELDTCELDERNRPSQEWSARAISLSRSTISIRSRRMCHAGRYLLVAIHLVDDKPIVLYGKVTHCQYESSSQHTISVDLEPLPDEPGIRTWISKLG